MHFTIANVPQTSRKAKVVRLYLSPLICKNSPSTCRWISLHLYFTPAQTFANLHTDLLAVERYKHREWQKHSGSHDLYSTLNGFATFQLQESTEKSLSARELANFRSIQTPANNSIESARFRKISAVKVCSAQSQQSDEHPVMWFRTIEILLTVEKYKRELSCSFANGSPRRVQ